MKDVTWISEKDSRAQQDLCPVFNRKYGEISDTKYFLRKAG